MTDTQVFYPPVPGQVEQLKEAYCVWLEEVVVSEENGWAMLQGRKKKPVDTEA